MSQIPEVVKSELADGDWLNQTRPRQIIDQIRPDQGWLDVWTVTGLATDWIGLDSTRLERVEQTGQTRPDEDVLET